MRNNWLFLMDLDGGSPGMFPVEPFYNYRYLYIHGSRALQEAFSCIPKFAGTLFLWLARGSNSSISDKLPGNSHASNLRSCKSSTQVNHITSAGHSLSGFCCNFGYKGPGISVIFGEIQRFAMKKLCGEAKQFQSFPLLSLAAALATPLDNVSRNVLAIPMENHDILRNRFMDQSPCEVEHRECADLSYPNLNSSRHAVEPRTGIEFPAILDNMFGDTASGLISEVLVGIGSRTMKIIKIKSLKVYAFGFYVHPYDVCKKLGPKYASIPVSEVNKHQKFYADLLSEDISMTVRLVVSCNGIKINSVRDAFEKSLRARLTKMNPDTDYDCLRTFGSLFSQDIPIRVGTTIDFRRTADGDLVTEIGGNQIGAVRSKDLCRAFFDMYIGDLPVSEQSKEEIGRNVVNIMRRC